MDKLEYEMMLQQTLRAVNEQYILPLALALGVMVVALCERHPESSQAVADILLERAEDCRKHDAAGWVLLKGLAGLAAPPTGDPSSPETQRNTFLRLIQGLKYPDRP